MPERLRSIASGLRAMNVNLACSAEDSAALQQARERLAELAAEIDQHAEAVVVVDRTVADRMNNFLMSVQTACDLLRGSNVSSDVCQHLRLTVEHGRVAVSDIRRALAMM